MTQASPLDYLFGLEQHGIKLGLDNIRTLCAALGHPERSFPSVIVAGTNGKGSVAAIIDTALRASGLVTGRFTSPHLIQLEERFCINGRPISHDTLSDAAARLQDIIGELQESRRLETPPTFFEATTALAFTLFQRSGVEMAVVEVGMGGQYDATNIVTPIAAVITTVDLDHQQFLGQTLPEIAFEKAGVIKPRILVVTAETKPAALDVVRRVCRERHARLVESPQGVTTMVVLRDGVTELELTTPRTSYGRLRLSLRGRHQVDNACAAVRLLEELDVVPPVPPTAIETGLTTTHWPGRLELLPGTGHRSVLLDAAHNGAAAAALGPLPVRGIPDRPTSGVRGDARQGCRRHHSDPRATCHPCRVHLAPEPTCVSGTRTGRDHRRRVPRHPHRGGGFAPRRAGICVGER